LSKQTKIIHCLQLVATTVSCQEELLQ